MKKTKLAGLVLYGRDECTHINPTTDSLLVNWIDIDTVEKSFKPVIRFFGVDSFGSSVSIYVHGFVPYFYCDMPIAGTMCEERLRIFKESLNNAVIDSRHKFLKDSKETNVVVDIKIVNKQTVLGYHPIDNFVNMLQIFLKNPALIQPTKGILERGFKASSLFQEKQFQTYESNVAFPLRYMVDRSIVGCNWVELQAGQYTERKTNESACQREYDVMWDKLISHPTSTHSKIGKLRILSFDIECLGRKGVFPDATKDPVIQIASYVHYHGESSYEKTKKVIFVLGGCTPIIGSDVFSFNKEEELLLSWSEFVRETDPDILTGYNIQDFDIPYLMNRATQLKLNDSFFLIGRVKGSKAVMKNTTFSSSAFGRRDSVETKIEGRIQIDMIQYMRRNHKLSSYSLNAVSTEFLNSQKEDVHHSMISVLQQGTDDDRRRLAVYCLKDAFLPLQLMTKLLVLVNYVEMARVTGVPINFLFSRGQQIKVLSMMYRKARQYDMVIPVFPHSERGGGGGNGGKKKGGDSDDEDEDGVGYEGATVLKPICGFYQEPIATLDFASLYPSILRAHNLCYTTLLTPEQAMEMDSSLYIKSPNGDYFVKPSVRQGLLPEILSDLLNARSQAKKDMKNATDEFERDVMNGRQLALKISANSVYGFTGATVGALPCLAISASVTSYGRDMIEATKAFVESKYTVENGYTSDAQVIYGERILNYTLGVKTIINNIINQKGDTDSVMVKFGVKTVAEALELGKEAAKLATKALFVNPISLEFEKVYSPYLLIGKKRYAGLYWTNSVKYDKLDVKGLENVRRDNCKLVRIMMDTCLKKILIEQKVDDAVNYVKKQISDLLQNKMDISLLIISKSLSRSTDDYKNPQPHTVLADKIKKRDPGNAPATGDRVPYVIIKAAKNAKVCDKSENPLYALENSIPIDTNYYLENQLSKPLLRLFESILPDPMILLKGDHVRHVVKITPITGGLMKFVTKTEKCMGCKAPIPTGTSDQALCVSCEPKRTELYLENIQKLNEISEKFNKLWTQCQSCQSSFHQEVICSANDCDIFYLRTKTKKDLGEIEDILNKF
jgi:DNA polymerase delta subunit 1